MLRRLQTDRERLDSFRAAVNHLDQAAGVGLDAEHQLECDFALGISRSAIGDAVGAEQPLQRFVKNSLGDKVPKPPPEFFEAAAARGQLSRSARAVALAAGDRPQRRRLKKTNLGPKERDETLLRRAQINVALHDGEQSAGIAEAKSQRRRPQSRARPSSGPRSTLRSNAFRTRFTSSNRSLRSRPASTASIRGRPCSCSASAMKSRKTTKTHCESTPTWSAVFPTAKRGWPRTSVARSCCARRSAWEEALDGYVKALETIHPVGFSNRWLRLDDFRAIVVAAWDDLKRTHAYEFAVELAKHMRPLFPPDQAYQAVERVATANELLASQLEAEIANRPYHVREQRDAELLERWRTSGKAYADLAESLHESPNYADVLWTSSEHYRKGHDFQNALVQITRYINTQPRQRLPMAYVRRGEILMDLGRFDEALDHFERVLAEFPSTSPRSPPCIWSAPAKSNAISPIRRCRLAAGVPRTASRSVGQ